MERTVGGVGLAAGPSAPSSRRTGPMRRVTRIAVAAVAAAGLFVGLGLGLWHRPASPATEASGAVQQRQSSALSDAPLVGTVSLPQAITALQERLRRLPDDWRSYAGLGLAYVQEARITADPGYYPKAQGVLRRSLALKARQNDVADIGMGALAAARHDFAGALAWGRRAHRIDPYADTVHGARAAACRGCPTVAPRYPLPQYVIALGDLQTVAGDAAGAARSYALVRTEEALFKANGVNVDLELALFDTGHGEVGAGLAAARQEWARRHSILVADALAWALYRSGDALAALRYERSATSLGMRDALFFFHEGMIERALGRTAAARSDLRAALSIDPNFSILHAAQARAALREPGGAR